MLIAHVLTAALVSATYCGGSSEQARMFVEFTPNGRSVGGADLTALQGLGALARANPSFFFHVSAFGDSGEVAPATDWAPATTDLARGRAAEIQRQLSAAGAAADQLGGDAYGYASTGGDPSWTDASGRQWISRAVVIVTAREPEPTDGRPRPAC